MTTLVPAEGDRWVAGVVALAAVDPLAGAEVLGEPSVYWERPLAREAVAGWGEAAAVEARSAAQAQAVLKALSAPASVRWLGEAPVALPGPWFGGMRFVGSGCGTRAGCPSASVGGRCRRWWCGARARSLRGGGLRARGPGSRGRGALAAGAGARRPSRRPTAIRGGGPQRCGCPRRGRTSRGGWSARWRRSPPGASRRWCWRGRWRWRASAPSMWWTCWPGCASRTRAAPPSSSGRRTGRPSWAPRRRRCAGGRGGTLETEALAGSASPAQAGTLEASDKDRREHESVVRYILKALKPLAERIDADAEPALLTLKNVVHLRTGIRAELREGVGRGRIGRGAAPHAGGGRRAPGAGAGASSSSTRPWIGAGTRGRSAG